MLYKVIKTPQGYVAVSDDKIEEGDYFLNLVQNIIYIHNIKNYNTAKEYLKKIIASDATFKLGDLPQFYLDDKIRQLGIESANRISFFPREKDKKFYVDGFEIGYKTAINKGCYTEKDIIKAINWGIANKSQITPELEEVEIGNFIKSLIQPKELIGIEVETEFTPINHASGLKLTGHPLMDISIKTNHIPKIINSSEHPNGLLIVKKYETI